MRLWTFVLAVGLVGCVGGPGDGFGGDGGGGSSGSSGSSGPSSSSGGAGTQVHASDFDQTCKVASDCAAIYEGEVCTPCPCPNAAIATSQASSYQSKVTSIRATCGPMPGIACQCAARVPACAGSKCGVNVGIVDAGKG